VSVAVNDYEFECADVLKLLGFENGRTYEMSKGELFKKASDALDQGIGIMIQPYVVLKIILTFHSLLTQRKESFVKGR